MSPRPRRPGNRDLPPNTYACKARGHIYYRYRHPVTGKFHSIGQDKEVAIRRGQALNAAILSDIEDRKLSSIIATTTPGTITVAQWCRQYERVNLERKRKNGILRKSTLDTKSGILRAINAAHGQIRLANLATKDVATLLESYVSAGKTRMAQAVRAMYRELLTAAPTTSSSDAGKSSNG